MDKIREEVNRMSLYVRRAWDARMPIGWILPERYIYDFEILYVKEGSLQVTVGDVRYVGIVGDLFFFVPGQIHSIKSIGTEQVRQPHIHFDFYFDENSECLEIPVEMPCSNHKMRENFLNNSKLFSIPTKLTVREPSYVDKLIQKIILEFAQKNIYSILKLKQLMFELLYYIFTSKYFNEKDGLPKSGVIDLFERANEYIQCNVDRSITIAEIADFVGYSGHYFVDIYKKFFGITPIAYHKSLRLEKAKDLIETTNLTMTEISSALGFEDLYCFSRYFKQGIGLSPLKYRQKIIKQGRNIL